MVLVDCSAKLIYPHRVEKSRRSLKKIIHYGGVRPRDFVLKWQKQYHTNETSDQVRVRTNTVESRFPEPPREKKIGSRNREFEKSGVKLEKSMSKGNENWFEKSGVTLEKSKSKGSENWFEKSGGLRNRGFPLYGYSLHK